MIIITLTFVPSSWPSVFISKLCGLRLYPGKITILSWHSRSRGQPSRHCCFIFNISTTAEKHQRFHNNSITQTVSSDRTQPHPLPYTHYATTWMYICPWRVPPSLESFNLICRLQIMFVVIIQMHLFPSLYIHSYLTGLLRAQRVALYGEWDSFHLCFI